MRFSLNAWYIFGALLINTYIYAYPTAAVVIVGVLTCSSDFFSHFCLTEFQVVERNLLGFQRSVKNWNFIPSQKGWTLRFGRNVR